MALPAGDRAHGSDRGPIRQAQGSVISLLQHLTSEYLGPADQLLGAGYVPVLTTSEATAFLLRVIEYEFALLSVGLISGRISGSYSSFDRLLLNSRPWLILLIVTSVNTSFRMSPMKKDPAAGHDETLSPVASIQSVPQQPLDLFDDANSQVNFRGVS